MIDQIATALSIFGAILNAKGKISGFFVWIIGNTLWVIYGYLTEQLYIMVVFATYTIISIYGINTWNKKKNDNTTGKKK